MRSRLFPPRRTVMALATACALTGCTGVEPDPAEAQRLESLAAGMDRCLAAQSATAEHLQLQWEQLAAQGQRLAVLNAQLEQLAAGREAPQEPAAGKSECPSRRDYGDKLVVGASEKVWLPDLEIELPARVDTGAEIAMLDARDIEIFERDGRRWVRFSVAASGDGEPHKLERRLEKTLAVAPSDGSSDAQKRPVVKLRVLIGDIDQTAEFVLDDRSHLDYPVLIGRNVLQDIMVVDVSRKNAAPYKRPKSKK